ncbi:FAD-dependent oxidoreductase (plasmid) [Arthrobacter sp. D3-18]
MNSIEQIVIVGNGHAGIQVGDSLRQEGFAGEIIVIGEEEHPPYQRPPLSKDYLGSGTDPAPLPLRAAKFFTENNIAMRLGVSVTSIDPARQTVKLSDRSTLGYSKLVLTTGAANRALTVPGVDLAGIHGLRSLDDALAVQRCLSSANRVVIIGAGFIGLEFAAAARKRGLEVTVLEFGDRPMARALSPVMGDWFAQAHRDMGTNLRLGEGIASFTGDGAGFVSSAVSTSGAIYSADMVVVGVGAIPRTELAEQAGLAVSNGITVDAAMRTSDPDIYALGDCANFPCSQTGTRIRLESVQNATDQARHVARSILGSNEPGREDYTEHPWFWSNQGPARLQIAGLLSAGAHSVIRGEAASGAFSVLHYDGASLVCVESVNRPADHVAARSMLASGISPCPELAADPDIRLKDLASAVERVSS